LIDLCRTVTYLLKDRLLFVHIPTTSSQGFENGGFRW
jgi:hypothetical protein